MDPAMRRAIILLTLALNGGLLTACAGAGQTAHTTRSPGAGTTAASTDAALSREQAVAYAQAVNLTSADVPGFTGSAQRPQRSAREARLEHAMLSCAGSVGSESALAEVGSKDFELKRGILNLSVSSEVTVAHTAAAALRTLASIRDAHIRECFSRFLDALIKGENLDGATVGPVSIQSGTPPAPGTAGGFGWRVTVPLTVHQLGVSFYLDILGFVYGPAEVTLSSTGLVQPFPAAIEQQLFKLLLARAKAHAP
jgi:hypothetical protein